MKYCTQCGHANEDDALFCEKDGCRLDKTVEDIQSKDIKTQVCEKCGFENGIDMKFCGKCGSAFDKNKRKKDKNGGTPIVTVFSIPFVVIVCLCVVAYSYDKDFSDWSEFLQGSSKKETYLNVTCHHSEEIDIDGETISFRIDTNADWFNIKNIDISVFNTCGACLSRSDSKVYYLGEESLDNKNFAKKPIFDVEFIDERSFRITINRNRGYNRCFRIEVRDPQGRVYSWYSRGFYQDGYKGIER